MWFALVRFACRRIETSLRHETWWTVILGTLFLVLAGCATKPRPGVTCNVSIITVGSDGEVVPQGPVTRVQSAAVNTETKINHKGSTFTLFIRKTEYGKVTLDVAFPGLLPQRVRIKAGATEDVLPEGQTIGLRIDVIDCH
jgi:hypothetical protein